MTKQKVFVVGVAADARDELNKALSEGWEIAKGGIHVGVGGTGTYPHWLVVVEKPETPVK